jgi:hypothetical protein
MKRLLSVVVIVAFGSIVHAQAPAPTDRSKATLFTSADLKAALGKLPKDRTRIGRSCST